MLSYRIEVRKTGEPVFRMVSGTVRRGERARKEAKEERETREAKERERGGVQRSRKEKKKITRPHAGR